ncbi:MAG: EcoRII N-terminal effector-binding domain-containing protein [Coriobacteriia bacterium]
MRLLTLSRHCKYPLCRGEEMLTKTSTSISKILSSNDTGETGTHQAGILVPKNPEILSYFPTLVSKEKNPRTALAFMDDASSTWIFAFIYYNNKYYGGTRNEYRLTGMTAFLRSHNLKAGDTLILGEPDLQGIRSIRYLRSKSESVGTVLRFGETWKVWIEKGGNKHG